MECTQIKPAENEVVYIWYTGMPSYSQDTFLKWLQIAKFTNKVKEWNTHTYPLNELCMKGI
jgi:hypothetical protein